MFTKSELTMWHDNEHEKKVRVEDHEIDAKYERGEQRIVTEANREKLPNFVDALDRPEYMDLHPFYQRRKRWNEEKQSKLIESFIMNIPVPPIFLYEKKFNQYEVMDGQQRITAIRDFYKNKLRLQNLESWPELNGMTYLTLPTKVRAGVDRRSLSSIVLLKESAPNEEGDWLLKRMVFERLNTGGEKLSHQEVRNCLYYGELNRILLQLSENPHLRRAWGIPNLPIDKTTKEAPPKLADNLKYKKMLDCEYVLRFFALRHWKDFRGGMQEFLDRYMIRSMSFSKGDFDQLAHMFEDTIEVCAELFGDKMFRPYDPDTKEWDDRPSVPFADAVMVAIGAHIDKRSTILKRKEEIVQRTISLFDTCPPATFTGSANTKADVQNRIETYSKMIAEMSA